jgi:hypothetical protein
MVKKERLLSLQNLLKMCEASPQYVRGDQWAVSTIINLRAEIQTLMEVIEGERRLFQSHHSFQQE